MDNLRVFRDGAAPCDLRTLPVPDRLDGAYRARPVALLAGSGPLTEPLAAALRVDGWTVHIGRLPRAGVDRLDLAAYLAPASVPSWRAAAASLAEVLLFASDTRPLLEATADEGRAALLTVSTLDGALGLSAVHTVAASMIGGLPWLVQVLAADAPTLWCRAVDLAGEMDAGRAVRLLLAELHDAEACLTQVGHGADGTRCTTRSTVVPGGAGLTRSARPPGAEQPVATGAPAGGQELVAPAGRQGQPLVVRRGLEALAADPVLAARALGGAPELPVSAAIGAILNVTSRLWPGRRLRELREFTVLRGVTFDGGHPDELRFTIAADSVVTVSDSAGRPRYRARVGAGPSGAPPRLAGLPSIDAGEPARVYGDVPRGIERVLADDGRRLVLAARLADVPLAGGAFGVDGYSPVLADVLVQAALLEAQEHRTSPVRLARRSRSVRSSSTARCPAANRS